MELKFSKAVSARNSEDRELWKKFYHYLFDDSTDSSLKLTIKSTLGGPRTPLLKYSMKLSKMEKNFLPQLEVGSKSLQWTLILFINRTKTHSRKAIKTLTGQAPSQREYDTSLCRIWTLAHEISCERLTKFWRRLGDCSLHCKSNGTSPSLNEGAVIEIDIDCDMSTRTRSSMHTFSAPQHKSVVTPTSFPGNGRAVDKSRNYSSSSTTSTTNKQPIGC